ncbi:alpha/beta hydrolase-fold protein [Ascidiimonas aurantiaca]|uniref:alpha/beta hydrolase-fold protein n=1 Tax=Ascidiimonas aurantiaca TaxID=1685432 RepID=UPI0030EE42B8
MAALVSITAPQRSYHTPVIIGEKHTIVSEHLNESRTYRIYTPPSYELSKNMQYRVLYLLDGDQSKFHESTGIIQSMNSVANLKMQIPELIIVAIENIDRIKDFTPTHSISYKGHENQRAFSSSGGANRFVAFLEEELISQIDHSFRTTGENILVGHSLGGLFALHCFLDRPSLFAQYIVIDPSWSWGHSYILERAVTVLPKNRYPQSRMYIALANTLEENRFNQQAAEQFSNLIQQYTADAVTVKTRYFEEEKHLTLPIPALYYGLRFLFDGYDIGDFRNILKEPSMLTSHYKKASEHLGTKFVPAELYVNALGYLALYDHKLTEAAITIFEINVKNYPMSPNAWDSLAEAYTLKGNLPEAQRCYEKIAKLNPEYPHPQKIIEKR